MESLYKEAIADAKALRASAMANAKAALEEAFEPQLREMFRKTVEEAADDENIEEADEMGNAKHKVEEKKHKKDAEDLDTMEEIDEIDEIEEAEKVEEIDEIDEMEVMDETSLEEILGELEALAQEGENPDEKMEEDYTEDQMEEGEVDTNYEAKSEEDGEEEVEMDGEEEMDDEEMDGEEEEKVITITLGQLKDILAPYQGEEEGAEGAEGEEATDDINLDEIFAELEEASKEKVEEKKKEMKAGKETMDENEKESMDPTKVPGTEMQLKEANKTISYLQTQLKEVNLLNAKYLFMNKLFKAKSLTESQKIKAINAFDRATTVKEVKNTFATLNESFAVSKKKSINEGFASQAAGIAPKQTQTIESDPFISRMQVLAGINKK